MVQLHFLKTKTCELQTLNDPLGNLRPLIRFIPIFLFKFLRDIVIGSPDSNSLIIRTRSQLFFTKINKSSQMEDKFQLTISFVHETPETSTFSPCPAKRKGSTARSLTFQTQTAPPNLEPVATKLPSGEGQILP